MLFAIFEVSRLGTIIILKGPRSQPQRALKKAAPSPPPSAWSNDRILVRAWLPSLVVWVRVHVCFVCVNNVPKCTPHPRGGKFKSVVILLAPPADPSEYFFVFRDRILRVFLCAKRSCRFAQKSCSHLATLPCFVKILPLRVCGSGGKFGRHLLFRSGWASLKSPGAPFWLAAPNANQKRHRNGPQKGL